MRLISHSIGVLLLLVQSVSVSALTYLAPIDKAEWQLQKSPMECRLSQPIPNFGEAVFIKRAGTPVFFQLSARKLRVGSGVVTLTAEAPPWRPDTASVPLGEAISRPDNPVIELPQSLATGMLTELERGMLPVFGDLRSSRDGGLIKVGVSAVNFQAAYRDYKQCIAAMGVGGGFSPLERGHVESGRGMGTGDFSQLERSRVEFRQGSIALDATAHRQLDAIARLLLADQEISRCFVDGHTDSSGDSQANIAVSRTRAEAVAAYLVSKGVPTEKITLRYHGDRFPVASNDDEAGRSQNRRVTVRLEK